MVTLKVEIGISVYSKKERDEFCKTLSETILRMKGVCSVTKPEQMVDVSLKGKKFFVKCPLGHIQKSRSGWCLGDLTMRACETCGVIFDPTITSKVIYLTFNFGKVGKKMKWSKV